MNIVIELERTFLAKEIPDGLKNCKFKEVIDIYIPKSSEHPKLRIRKNGNKYEATKKEPVDEADKTVLREQTIGLTEAEFETLRKLEGKVVHKIRYDYDYKSNTAEVDVFQGALKGLVVVDFEFDNEDEKNKFEMPEFCLIDIKNEVFIAGGMICGKSYEDVEKELNRFGYKKLFL